MGERALDAHGPGAAHAARGDTRPTWTSCRPCSRVCSPPPTSGARRCWPDRSSTTRACSRPAARRSPSCARARDARRRASTAAGGGGARAALRSTWAKPAARPGPRGTPRGDPRPPLRGRAGAGPPGGRVPGGAPPEPFLPDDVRREVATASGPGASAAGGPLDRERYLFYVCASRAERLLVLSSRYERRGGHPRGAARSSSTT